MDIPNEKSIVCVVSSDGFDLKFRTGDNNKNRFRFRYIQILTQTLLRSSVYVNIEGRTILLLRMELPSRFSHPVAAGFEFFGLANHKKYHHQ